MTVTTLAQHGSNIVVASSVSESSAYQLKYRLPPLGITVRFVEDGGLERVRSAIDQNTQAVFIESLSIDGLVVADIESLALIAHENGVPLIVYVQLPRLNVPPNRNLTSFTEIIRMAPVATSYDQSIMALTLSLSLPLHGSAFLATTKVELSSTAANFLGRKTKPVFHYSSSLRQVSMA